MQVHHRLAGDLSDVDADVVAVGVEPLVEEVFCLPDEGEEGDLLCVGRVEEAGDVAEGDEEEVAGADRVFIVAGVAEVVCEHDHLFWRVAERAGQGVHAAYPRTSIK